jgi:septal ring factor EnvC (AmiA/AmiB activator)
MQFDPVRYPADFELKIVTTMGIVAREVEAAQMTQLVGMMPQEFHSVALQLIEGIVDHTSLQNKGEIMKAIQTITNPPPEVVQQQQQQQQQQQHMVQQMQQAQLQEQMIKNQKLLAEVKQILAKAQEIDHEAAANVARIHQDWERIELQRKQDQQFAEQNQIAAARLPIEAMKAHAALISAKRKPAGG